MSYIIIFDAIIGDDVEHTENVNGFKMNPIEFDNTKKLAM